MNGTLRVGTRGSQLALWQARTVGERLRDAGSAVELVVIKTTGDRLAEAPLSEAGGKRLFVKEIEDALLRGDVDLAVHSCKDMPVVLPDGLAIGAYLEREDPHDIVVLPRLLASSQDRASGGQGAGPPDRQMTIEQMVHRLGQSPNIGTSSIRRIAQLRRLLPQGRFEPIRGNLDTRLRKLDRSDHDALVLAAAGVRRLGFADRISTTLPFDVCVPAPGQGAIAIEVRSLDTATLDLVRRINHAPTASAAAAERAVVGRLGGGCQTPIGAIALISDATLRLTAVVASPDGTRLVRGSDVGDVQSAEEIGCRLGDRLIADGALEILHTQ